MGSEAISLPAPAQPRQVQDGPAEKSGIPGFTEELRSGIQGSQPEQGVAQMILKSPPLSPKRAHLRWHIRKVGQCSPRSLQFEEASVTRKWNGLYPHNFSTGEGMGCKPGKQPPSLPCRWIEPSRLALVWTRERPLPG